MPYTTQERTPEQQHEHERREAIRTLNVEAARAYAIQEGIGLIGDDQQVLISLHEARALDPAIPRYLQRESVRWLRANCPQSGVVKKHLDIVRKIV